MLLIITTLAILTGCISATLLTCFKKWRWLEYYEVYRRPWMPEPCEFCFGFWLSALMAFAYAGFAGYWPALLAPFVAAAITKKLLS